MKQLIFALLIFFTINTQAENTKETVKWFTLEEAVKLQAETPKKIFIDVYTDWCGYCKKMDKETFSNPVIAKYLNENFYPVKFDAEQKESIEFKSQTYRNTNPDRKRSSHELAQALLQGKMSYPSYAFLNEKSVLITVVPGYIPAPNFEPIIHYFGGNAFNKTEWEEFSKNFKSELK